LGLLEEVDIEALKQQPLSIREFGSGYRRVVENAIVAGRLRKKDLRIQMEL
jgi:hypothetical protein